MHSNKFWIENRWKCISYAINHKLSWILCCCSNSSFKVLKNLRRLVSGLQMQEGKFFIFFLNLFLTNMAASGLGFVISASVRVFAIANLLVSLVYIIMMVLYLKRVSKQQLQIDYRHLLLHWMTTNAIFLFHGSRPSLLLTKNLFVNKL